jgi:hypothetical protein
MTDKAMSLLRRRMIEDMTIRKPEKAWSKQARIMPSWAECLHRTQGRFAATQQYGSDER